MGNHFTSVDCKTELWFPTIVGVEEPELRNMSAEERSKFFYKDEDGCVRLKRGGGGGRKPHPKDIRCGILEVVPIASLMAEVYFENAPSSLHFTTRDDVDPESLRLVDVGHAQSLPENRGALFQVASNMNAIEGISQDVSVESKTFVSDYIYDKTQGPAASISAGGAAVARVYAAFPNDEGNFDRQTAIRQINFLAGLNQFCDVINGYVVLKDNADEWKAADKVKLTKEVACAIHREVQVTFGKRGPGFYEAVQNSEEQIIHQIFGAAVNLGQGMAGIQNRGKPHGRDFARFVLEAMYTGSFLAAQKLKCKKVFLTLLGGGVFANSMQDILSILCETFQLYGAGLEVHVTMFTPTPLTEELNAFLSQALQDSTWEYSIVHKGVKSKVFPKEK